MFICYDKLLSSRVVSLVSDADGPGSTPESAFYLNCALKKCKLCSIAKSLPIYLIISMAYSVSNKSSYHERLNRFVKVCQETLNIVVGPHPPCKNTCPMKPEIWKKLCSMKFKTKKWLQNPTMYFNLICYNSFHALNTRFVQIRRSIHFNSYIYIRSILSLFNLIHIYHCYNLFFSNSYALFVFVFFFCIASLSMKGIFKSALYAQLFSCKKYSRDWPLFNHLNSDFNKI